MRIVAAVMLLLPLGILSCSPSPSAESRRAAIAETIDALVADHPGAIVAVSIRDAATGVRYDRLGDRLFHAASTMKVPVMIEVHRLAETGRMALEDSIRVRNAFRSIVDGSPFAIEDDSDDALYEHIGAHVPVRELVRQMIVLSSNLATNLLIDVVGAESVQATSERLGTTRMQTLRGVEDLKAFDLGLNNRTTASDLALLFERLLEGKAVSREADQAMIDLMFDQTFRSMIPSRLPPGTRVAHKTGRISAVDHDAGIVWPDSGKPYVIVILTEGIEDDEESSELGAEIAAAVHDVLRPSA